MTRNQRRFAAALQQVGYSATESTRLAAPGAQTTVAQPARTAGRRAHRPASYAADAHPWAHDEE